MKPCTQRVYAALKKSGERGCSNVELSEPEVGGGRFGARIMELREEGHDIRTRIIRAGLTRYYLIPPAVETAVEPPVSVDGEDPQALFEVPVRRPASPYEDAA